MSTKYFTNLPSGLNTYTISTSDWIDYETHSPPISRNPATQQQQMLDELNHRLIDMENKLSAYASRVQTLEASNVVLTEMVEYLKAVANGDI